MRTLSIAIWTCGWLWWCGAGASFARDNDPTEPPAELEARIATLIRQLGAKSFASREKAHTELSRLGLTAFDALHDAQQDTDIEIALRARQLIRGMQVSWWRDSDTPDVKRLLRTYGDASEQERKNRMERLSQLQDFEGLDALCRLVRFETDMRLAKTAALLILNQPRPEPPAREAFVRRVLSGLGASRRPVSGWLRLHARTLEAPSESLDAWERVVEVESRALDEDPAATSRDIHRELLCWYAALLLREGRPDPALAVLRRSFALLDGTREELLEVCDWLINHEAWPAADELLTRYRDRFESNAILAYRWAEICRRRNRADEATARAQRALGLMPESFQEHLETAYALQSRGLFDWAEREYRLVVEKAPAESYHPFRARFLLAEMLHDQLREHDAALVLQAVSDAMEKEEVAQMVESHGTHSRGGIRSRMHSFYALHFGTQGDRAKQRQHLQSGAEADPSDADLLIGMYRLPDADDAWKKRTQGLIKEASQQFRGQITEYRRQLTETPQEELREMLMKALALVNNQLAWLVSNTEGDYDEALQCSHAACEVRPDAGYFDTLGRCYFAKGDLAGAVKYQSLAVKLDPHSGQIRRQLELFRKAQEMAN